MGGACSTGAYTLLVGRPEVRRLLRRPKLRREDNIKRIFKRWDERHGLD
jgi:hypothetical protein